MVPRLRQKEYSDAPRGPDPCRSIDAPWSAAGLFGGPGESFLAALDGLHDSGIANIVCRQEGGAAMMAEAHGKMTGQPGICFVTRGPGATNASAGVHVARQDSTPMILFVGQIETGIATARRSRRLITGRFSAGWRNGWPRSTRPRESPSMSRVRSGWLRRGGRGRGSGTARGHAVRRGEVPDRSPVGEVKPDLSGAARAAMEVLAVAERPLVVVGGPQWSAEAARNLARLVEVFRGCRWRWGSDGRITSTTGIRINRAT